MLKHFSLLAGATVLAFLGFAQAATVTSMQWRCLSRGQPPSMRSTSSAASNVTEVTGSMPSLPGSPTGLVFSSPRRSMWPMAALT